jgi:hypothetical protein
MPTRPKKTEWHTLCIRFRKESMVDIDAARKKSGDTRSNHVRRCVQFVSQQRRLGNPVGYIDERKRFVEVVF